MGTTDSKSPVRERILATAADLFYRQGYRATGVNQVIAESNVAKASFYAQFPSKDDLLYAYISETARREIADVRASAALPSTARERFFVPLGILRPWFEATDYRGCPFQNIAAEAPPDDPRVRQVIRLYREDMRNLFHELARDLIQEESELVSLNAKELADSYLVLFEGAIALSVAYREPWPLEQAIRSLTACLERD